MEQSISNETVDQIENLKKKYEKFQDKIDNVYNSYNIDSFLDDNKLKDNSSSLEMMEYLSKFVKSYYKLRDDLNSFTGNLSQPTIPKKQEVKRVFEEPVSELEKNRKMQFAPPFIALMIGAALVQLSNILDTDLMLAAILFSFLGVIIFFIGFVGIVVWPLAYSFYVFPKIIQKNDIEKKRATPEYQNYLANMNAQYDSQDAENEKIYADAMKVYQSETEVYEWRVAENSKLKDKFEVNRKKMLSYIGQKTKIYPILNTILCSYSLSEIAPIYELMLTSDLSIEDASKQRYQYLKEKERKEEEVKLEQARLRAIEQQAAEQRRMAREEERMIEREMRANEQMIERQTRAAAQPSYSSSSSSKNQKQHLRGSAGCYLNNLKPGYIVPSDCLKCPHHRYCADNKF